MESDKIKYTWLLYWKYYTEYIFNNLNLKKYTFDFTYFSCKESLYIQDIQLYTDNLQILNGKNSNIKNGNSLFANLKLKLSNYNFGLCKSFGIPLSHLFCIKLKVCLYSVCNVLRITITPEIVLGGLVYV